MSSYFRNPELKSTGAKLIIMHLVFFGIMFLFVHHEINILNNKVVDQNTSMVGQVLSKHPELEDDIVRSVTKPANSKEVAKGKEVLNNYNYHKKLSLSSQPLLKNVGPSFQAKMSILILVYIIPMLILIYFEYLKIYGKARTISLASESVVEGNFNTILSEEEEGDFAILGHNFNNMANRLKFSMESLKEDKVFLKNIISDISHQLKTPLSSLYAINDILLENPSMEPEIQKDFLEKNRSQLNRMEWLIRNLLKMARLEAGAIDLKIKRVCIKDTIHKSMEPLWDKAKEKRINIDISNNTETYFSGDNEWMAEAFSNILKNCIEHTSIYGNIKVSSFETPLLSTITIEDNGEGIPKEELPYIFRRFYKGVNTLKPDSIGIGLALSKLIIESQNGSISVESKIGQGTRFTINFTKQ